MLWNTTHLGDVGAFSRRFGLKMPETPTPLTDDEATFRIDFLKEEVREFEDAVNAKNLTKQLDALLDIVYVAIGTAIMLGMGNLWQACWNLVQHANMQKKTAKELGLRGRHPSDVCKPDGWEAPDRQISILIIREIDNAKEQASLIPVEELAR